MSTEESKVYPTGAYKLQKVKIRIVHNGARQAHLIILLNLTFIAPTLQSLFHCYLSGIYDTDLVR